MRDEDGTIRATARNLLAKTRLRNYTNETIHDDGDNAIRVKRSETVCDNKTEQYAREGARRYATKRHCNTRRKERDGTRRKE